MTDYERRCTCGHRMSRHVIMDLGTGEALCLGPSDDNPCGCVHWQLGGWTGTPPVVDRDAAPVGE